MGEETKKYEVHMSFNLVVEATSLQQAVSYAGYQIPVDARHATIQCYGEFQENQAANHAVGIPTIAP